MNLNPQQRQAVSHLQGPLLVLAGAGSGKTRVMVHRIQYMIQKGIDPSSIVALSFTHKAARELSERLAGMLSQKVISSTFHALGANLIQREKKALPRPLEQLIDAHTQRSIVRALIQNFGWPMERELLQTALQMISKAKMNFCTPLDFVNRFDPWKYRWNRLYKAYVQTLEDLKAFDFDDLILIPIQLFENPEIAQKYHKQWQYFLVDEYQDTNPAQFRWLCQMIGTAQNLMVVGDDDQAIYGFRGADAKHILEFPSHFPNAKIIRLEQNYRSTQNILNTANALIAHNQHRFGKRLWTELPQGSRIRIVPTKDPKEEAIFVAKDILEHHWNFQDVAVLYRVHPLARPLEEVFRSYNIPFELTGTQSFFDHREVRDLIQYLRILANPHDDLAMHHALHHPPKRIHAKVWQSFVNFKAQRSIWSALPDFSWPDHVAPKIQSFVQILQELLNSQSQVESHVLLQNFLDRIHYLHFVAQKKSPEQREWAWKRVETLIDILKNWNICHPKGSIHEFLQSLFVEPPVDSNARGKVQGMTMHASKGLEFPVVYIIGLQKDLMPHQRALLDKDGIESERRLFYVALTRAQRELILCYPEHRSQGIALQKVKPSPFLEELPKASITYDRVLAEKIQEDRTQSYIQAFLDALES